MLTECRTCRYTRIKNAWRQASVWTYFSPQTPECLALLAGCEVDDLPVFLQNWWAQKQYKGNSILDRLDPLDWLPKNPWFTEKFNVVLGLSKSTWNQLLRERNLPKRELEEVKRVWYRW